MKERKNSLQTHSLSDFASFYQTYGGAVEEREVQGDGTYTTGNRTRLQELIKRIGNTVDGYEASMYEPMPALLTTVSLDIAPKDAERVLIFVPHPEKKLSSTCGSGEDQPDLIAFFEERRTAEAIARGEQYTGESPSILLIRSCVEMKVRNVSAFFQSMRHLFHFSRHDPSSWTAHGLFADRKRFQLFSLGLDKEAKWKEVLWQDENKIDMLYAYVGIILDSVSQEVPSVFPKIIPDSAFDLENRKTFLYSATLGQTEFTLLPIYYGRASGRKPFVAVGVHTAGPQANPGTVRMLKYSWYKGTQHRREFEILMKLRGVPGVVQIDESLCCDSILKDGWSGRERSLLCLRTIGYPLCSCKSVLEFLEAMYDLLEVLRYLVQEKEVFHRDVSLKNILIRPEYAPDVKIERRTQPTMEPMPHTYRFISDILNEKDRTVRVALADFDLATDLGNSSESELKDATGTPMFMANDVLEPRQNETVKYPPARAKRLTDAAQKATRKYLDDQSERMAWDEFYQNLLNVEEMHPFNSQDFFMHGPVHDAESVFFLCFLFFNRMQRVGSGNTTDASQEEAWGWAFDALASKDVKRPAWSIIIRPLIDDGIDSDFQQMISLMNDYLSIPWYNVKFTGRGNKYEFHLHDFMQRLLLEEIGKLREANNPIWIEEKPRKVRTKSATGRDFSSCSRSLGSMTSRDLPRLMRDFPTETTNHITRQSKPRAVFPESHFRLLKLKERERLWTSADGIA